MTAKNKKNQVILICLLVGRLLITLTMSNLISAVSWVKRGVATRTPQKYVLDNKELQRVSALAKIELEDARVELERAHQAAQSMGKGEEGEEADEHGSDDVAAVGEDDNDANWAE